MKKKYCSMCGYKFGNFDLYCSQCGTKLFDNPSTYIKLSTNNKAKTNIKPETNTKPETDIKPDTGFMESIAKVYGLGKEKYSGQKKMKCPKCNGKGYLYLKKPYPKDATILILGDIFLGLPSCQEECNFCRGEGYLLPK